MFHLDNVTLRPMELADVDLAYNWHLDIEVEIFSGWGPRQSRATFQKKYEQFIAGPEEAVRVLGIEVDGNLIGRIELAFLDSVQRVSSFGIIIPAKQHRERGFGGTATRIMLDYAFTVENLERVYAYVYSFNIPCMKMLEKVGFVHEGVLRQHEIHNGKRQDLHVFGILKAEFYGRYESIFLISSCPPLNAG